MYRSYRSTNSSSSSSSNLVESNNQSTCQSSVSMGSGSSKNTDGKIKSASKRSSPSQDSSGNSKPISSESTAQPDSNSTSKNLKTLQDNIMSEKIQGSTPRAVKWLDMNINNLMKDMNISDDGQQWWKAVDKLIDKNPPKIIPDTQRKMWKTVRLFISSTFKDMNNEREYLVKIIIPVLRQWCEERKIRLIECDLRWGVPKDADTRETLMACLSEIDRCREENEFPYFLCMLSERYGYVCDPAEVPEDIKVRYNWLPGMSVTALEIFTGAYWDRNPHALYMLRDPVFLSNVKDKNILKGYQETKPESIESLQILKGKLREHYRDNIKEYKCELAEEKDEQLILTGFKTFGEDIIKHFKASIENQYPATSLGEEMTDIEIQKGQQLDFLLQRSHFLVGRDEALSTMTDYINQDCNKSDLLVLVGYPGAGKSSLMAYSAKQLLTNKTNKVFYHFVGATPDSTDPYSILTRFYKECMPEDDNMPPDLDSMLRYAQTMFQKAGELAKQEGYERLVIYFDALNQMDEDGETSRLTWLPSVLTPELRIIVSTLEGDCLNALRSRDIKTKEVPVEPLNIEIRKDIVSKILAEYNKLLDQEQMQLLIDKDDAGRPLWLSLACEELRVTGDFRGLTEKIQNLPGDLSGLTQIILERVVKFYGEELVEASLCLLESSRFGLMESELLELLALAPITYSKNTKTDNVENGKILMAQWAFVYLGLKPFLRPFGGSGEGRLDFYHRSTSKVIRQVYLEDSSVKKWWHQRLADYFQRCTDSVRKAEELPFQLYQLDDKENLMKCLVSPDVFLHLCEEKSKQVLMKFWLWADNYEGAAKRYIQFLDDFCEVIYILL
ncbi:TPR repeat-containing protein DDB_G0287407 isoform X2 [Patella vulgata]|uniref:TPR repeat-containing protein DDB_G0287407 isoform X2 n=1 Tax=Patella vulgata TaxID=6465 RepID=UPI0021808F66|nr:TPR repeat-containing protein DDB_G0287407 isoform X2 [Patella vulgata]